MSEEKHLCAACVGEDFLRAKINEKGRDATCTYCGRGGRTFSLSEMADEIDIALQEHFHRTPTEPSGLEYLAIKEGDLEWDRQGDPIADVIGSYAQITEEAAQDIRRELQMSHYDRESAEMGEEGPYDRDAHYHEREVDSSESCMGWQEFERRLKTEVRFFSLRARETLVSTFEELETHKTRDGKSIVVDAGPAMSLSADPQLNLQLVQQTLEPARVSAGFHAHAHCHGALAEFAVELLGLFLVPQACFAQFARVAVYVRNLLEARVLVTSYNDHVRLLFSRAFLVGFSTHQLYSGRGADIVMESLHSKPLPWRPGPGGLDASRLTLTSSAVWEAQ